MFTGLIEEIGTISKIRTQEQGAEISIRAPKLRTQLGVGDSVAINGICLTLVQLQEQGFVVQAVAETIQRTTLPEWRIGDLVNLEPPLSLQGRLHGHWVSGHIDQVAVIQLITPEGDGRRVDLEIPAALSRYLAAKGSITLDGISLTIVDVLTRTRVQVALIPHTLQHTTAKAWVQGKKVNLEVDLLARYLEQLVNSDNQPNSELTMNKLSQYGY
jgi:riboflavin synthase